MTDIVEPLGDYFDMRGIPIREGDLVRHRHYRHYLRKEQMWVYFRVVTIDGHLCMRAWNDFRTDSWQCRVEDMLTELDCQVLASGSLERNQHGEVITFNERKRKTRRDSATVNAD